MLTCNRNLFHLTLLNLSSISDSAQYEETDQVN